MRFFLALMLLFAFVPPAAAQLVGLGVEGGARVSTDVFGTANPESKRYIVGPRVDVHLPRNFSVEVDALYRTFGFTGYETSTVINEIVRGRSNSWELPTLIKYRYPGFLAHPFIGAGYDPRFVHGNTVTNGSYVSGVTSGVTTYTYLTNQQSATSYPVSNGAVVNGGMDFVVGPVHIAPELRYIHWTPPFLNVNPGGSAGSYKFNSGHNELMVLFGVTWH